ncbi:MAG: hypothetical protein O2917_10575 [Acidobacteria bacterium]|nr:hypothetical protein [Acidobacteriota bacterium]
MFGVPTVRVLSFHAGYACKHTGRCCASDWPIAVDADHAARLHDVLAVAGVEHHPEGVILLARDRGTCVFRDQHSAGGCRIQRSLGEAAVPLECRQFPRQSVSDPRGTSVTLSHYCPTARAQLEADTGAVTIRTGAPGFPVSGEYVGLQANPDLPPLLHPRCVLDWIQWWAIEAAAVALVTAMPDTALPRLALAVESLRTWQPSSLPLRDAVHRAFDLAAVERLPPWVPSEALLTSHRADLQVAIPRAWQAQADTALSTRHPPLAGPTFGRFLAAHVFANWAAYTGHGLRTWYRSIEAAGCLVWRTGDPGAADLVLRHLADSSALIARWSLAERSPVIRRP